MTRGVPAAAALAAVLAVVMAAGCGQRKGVVAPEPGTVLPPHVTGVMPAVRSVRVDYDTPIWVRFDEPLDSTTVNATTVFLKIDTRRIPVDVALADTGMRIVIQPRHALEIRRTHTIEISPRVRTRSGHAFSDGFFWQFTTMAVRRIESPTPASGAIGRSPVEPLMWDSTETVAGDVKYRLYFSSDSAQVAAGASPAVDVDQSWYLPRNRWATAAPWYWKVRVVNQDTGDEFTGPVWRFDVHPPGPVDSVTIPVGNVGTYDKTAHLWRCSTLTSGTGSAPEAQFDLSALDSGLVIDRAVMRLQTNSRIDATRTFPQLWEISEPWTACDATRPGPPTLPDPPLAGGNIDQGFMTFESDLLGAQVQGRIHRQAQYHDYTFRSATTISYNPLVFDTGLRIYYYIPTQPLARARTQGRSR